MREGGGDRSRRYSEGNHQPPMLYLRLSCQLRTVGAQLGQHLKENVSRMYITKLCGVGVFTDVLVTCVYSFI